MKDAVEGALRAFRLGVLSRRPGIGGGRDSAPRRHAAGGRQPVGSEDVRPGWVHSWAATGAVAALIPARILSHQAANVDPSVALRDE